MLHTRCARRSVALSLAAVACVGLASATPLGVAHAARPWRLRVAVPAYVASNDLRSWESLLRRSDALGVVVINPRSGPNVYRNPLCAGQPEPTPGPTTGPDLSGLRLDDTFVPQVFTDDPTLVTLSPTYVPTVESHFARRTAALRAASVEVFGYVWLNANGANPSCPRDLSVVRSDIDRYRTVFGVANVFLDDSSGECGPAVETMRQSVKAYVASFGGRVIANLGYAGSACVADDADIVVNFEGPASDYLTPNTQAILASNAESMRAVSPLVQVWRIVYGVSASAVDGVVVAAAASADLLYITDDGLNVRTCDRVPNPFDSLYGTWPLVRPGDAECANRTYGSPLGWADVVASIADRSNRTSTVTVPSRTSSRLPVSSGAIGSAPRSRGPAARGPR